MGDAAQVQPKLARGCESLNWREPPAVRDVEGDKTQPSRGHSASLWQPWGPIQPGNGLTGLPTDRKVHVPKFTAVIAQLVRAQDCGSWGRGFESRWPPHFNLTPRRSPSLAIIRPDKGKRLPCRRRFYFQHELW